MPGSTKAASRRRKSTALLESEMPVPFDGSFDPIFIGARLDAECADNIDNAVHKMLGNKIPAGCFCPKRDYHITVLYSKKGTVNNVVPYNPHLVAFGREPVGTGWGLAHMCNGTIALLLVSKFICQLHKSFYAVSASRDKFSAYVPHVTVATDVPCVPFLKKFINVPICLNFLYAEPIKLDAL